MPRAELQLTLFPDRLPFASGLPIGMARGDRKFAMPTTSAAPPVGSPAWSAYQEYLRSPRWAELRDQALERDGYRCRCCPNTTKLQVHHRRYPKVWGAESVEDLTTLCAGCHLIIGWFRSGDSRARMHRLVRR